MNVRIQSTEEQTKIQWTDSIGSMGFFNVSFGGQPQTVIFNNMGAVGFHSFGDCRPMVLDVRDVAAVEIMRFLDYKASPELIESPAIKERGAAVAASTALFFFKKDGTRLLFSVNNNTHDGNLKIITALKSAFDEAVAVADTFTASTEDFAASAADVFNQLAPVQTRAGLVTWQDFGKLGMGLLLAGIGTSAAAEGAPLLTSAAFVALGGWLFLWPASADMWRLVALRWLRLLLWPAFFQLAAVLSVCGAIWWQGAGLLANKGHVPWSLSFGFLASVTLLVGFVRCHKWAALGLLVGLPLDMPRGFGASIPVWRSFLNGKTNKRGHKWANIFVYSMGPLSLFGIANDYYLHWFPYSEERHIGNFVWLGLVWLVVIHYGPAVFKEKGGQS